MADFSRVTPTGWLQGDDASESSRVTPDGWQQIPAAAGSSLPTLSLPTYVPGSLTTTGFRPRVTYTF